MPRPDRPDVTQTYVELPNDDYATLRAFCAERGTTLRHEILTAIRRHLASPPPPPERVPLPPPRPRGRPRKQP